MESKEILVGKRKRNDFLKAFAMLTMLIDHIGYLFFPSMMIFRTIGRMAFPIFGYFIACGYDYTSSLKNYMKRLLIIGFITQIPFSFFNREVEFRPFYFNILFTLFLGLVFIHGINTGIKYLKTKEIKKILIGLTIFLTLGLFIALEEYLITLGVRFDYGLYGIALILIFYYFRKKSLALVIAFFLLNASFGFYRIMFYTYTKFGNFGFALKQGKQMLINNSQAYLRLDSFYFQARAFFALVFIKSNFRNWVYLPLPSWVGYAFYPGHISILILIKLIMT